MKNSYSIPNQGSSN